MEWRIELITHCKHVEWYCWKTCYKKQGWGLISAEGVKLYNFTKEVCLFFRLSFLPNRSYSDNGRTILANEQESQDSLGPLWGGLDRAVTRSADEGDPWVGSQQSAVNGHVPVVLPDVHSMIQHCHHWLFFFYTYLDAVRGNLKVRGTIAGYQTSGETHYWLFLSVNDKRHIGAKFKYWL